MHQAVVKAYLQILTARFAAEPEEGHQNASQEAGFLTSKTRNTTPNFDSFQAKLRKAASSFVMSVRRNGTALLLMDTFPLNLAHRYSSEICLGNSSFVKI